jgi:DNA repair exonuclease SbcCD nuclease subunit
MTNLFKKAAVFTDIHFGLKSNSITHNEDCLAFVKWATAKAKAEGCETCLFLGDWHNNRAALNILTLNYSLRALEHMNNNFDAVYFIPGNHDLYYRDKRDIQSVEWARHLPNVHICNDWFSQGDVTICPWLVGDDHKKLLKKKGKYCFGHFELPGYYMNAMVQMPDIGEAKSEDLMGFEKVFSGHFHKRQTNSNITYIGNCFPHNYADDGDEERGMMILEWDKEPEYHAWPDQPTYRVLSLSSIVDHADKILKPRMHARINIDIDLSYEEANFIKETFMETYKLRELSLLPKKEIDNNEGVAIGEIKFESIDTIVQNQINAISSEHYDRNLLLDIYRNC